MSSAQLKSLMAAKRIQQQRINHPHATYDRQNRLTCALCLGVVLKHDNLWGAHLVSKGHRLNVQRFEEQQRRAVQEAEAAKSGKRKRSTADADGDADDDDDDDDAEDEVKRPREEDEEEEEGGAIGGSRSLPADFFADPSEAPTLPTHDGDDEGEASTAPNGAEAEVDPEWAAFEASLRPENDANLTTASTASATFTAAPVAYEFGAPKVAEEGEEGAEEDQEEEEETEEEKQARLEREEREEIMARIEAEEREQLEADAKVTALKRKLEAVKEARRKKKQGTSA